MRGGVEEPLSPAEAEGKFLANARHGGIAEPEPLLDVCSGLLAGPEAWRSIGRLQA